MGVAALLSVMAAVAAPHGGASAAVVRPASTATAGVASPCVPAKLTPLRATKPTPAQRVMPDLH